jgi:hypothetical protein
VPPLRYPMFQRRNEKLEKKVKEKKEEGMKIGKK